MWDEPKPKVGALGEQEQTRGSQQGGRDAAECDDHAQVVGKQQQRLVDPGGKGPDHTVRRRSPSSRHRQADGHDWRAAHFESALARPESRERHREKPHARTAEIR